LDVATDRPPKARSRRSSLPDHYQGKEVIMINKYERPVVVELSSACSAVRHQTKFPNITYDAMDRPTVGAYEADE
jgi:hypothetical protein